MPREFQLIEYLRLFAETGVEYVLVGGVGARIQGAATTTQDIDIMPERSVENLERLARSLSHDRAEDRRALDALYQARGHLREHPDAYELSDRALDPEHEIDET